MILEYFGEEDAAPCGNCDVCKRGGVIFHNTTLEFLTRLKPSTVEEGKDIRGIGEAKAGKYLPEFIEVISGHG